MEIALLTAYDAIINGIQSGRLAKVPPAIAGYMRDARFHHQAHLDHWNSLLVNSHQVAQTTADPPLNAEVRKALGSATKLTDAVKLAARLENVSTQTYVETTLLMSGNSSREWCALVAPIEAQHAAVLSFLLGADFAPSTFVGSDLARPPNDLGKS